MSLLWWLLISHVVCDYPLQGDFLARGKNHKNPIPGIPWYHCLVAHALIHGGGVALVTGSPMLGFIETMLHATIDWSKCNGDLSYTADQAAHLFCKLVIFVLYVYKVF